MYSKILVPIDHSELAERTIEEALAVRAGGCEGPRGVFLRARRVGSTVAGQTARCRSQRVEPPAAFR